MTRFYLLTLLFLTSLATPLTCGRQEESRKDSALLPESWARKSAINAVLPTYPDEAIRHGLGGVVRIRFETDPVGHVTTIKVQPGTHSLLRKAVINAVKQWKFKPSLGIDHVEVAVFSRLAFHFIIRKGEPLVEMYDQKPWPPANLCLACNNSYREMIEWDEWEVAWSKSEPGAVAPVLHP